ncbi:hypothetical protein NDU88_004540 [Pleurodeles waltl]|uniref:Uncharacterized protein n=1 Tax=Pleurodeles waltl TaxID=8319 RepID=A0AAV7RLW7_PLEWA|nr:hypothetical protein NDU88_004540 [Pleurodeles waltl]
MDILIRDAKEKRERVLAEIDTLEKEIRDTNLMETIEKNYNILKNVLQQHQEYIKEKKMCKLRRNANDYDTEMERFRRGQKYNRSAQVTHTKELEGVREKGAESVNSKIGMTTRSVTRNTKN